MCKLNVVGLCVAPQKTENMYWRVLSQSSYITQLHAVVLRDLRDLICVIAAAMTESHLLKPYSKQIWHYPRQLRSLSPFQFPLMLLYSYPCCSGAHMHAPLPRTRNNQALVKCAKLASFTDCRAQPRHSCSAL